MAEKQTNHAEWEAVRSVAERIKRDARFEVNAAVKGSASIWRIEAEELADLVLALHPPSQPPAEGERRIWQGHPPVVCDQQLGCEHVCRYPDQCHESGCGQPFMDHLPAPTPPQSEPGESPNFVPEQLEQFKARGFERVNRHSGEPGERHSLDCPQRFKGRDAAGNLPNPCTCAQTGRGEPGCHIYLGSSGNCMRPKGHAGSCEPFPAPSEDERRIGDLTREQWDVWARAQSDSLRVVERERHVKRLLALIAAAFDGRSK